MTFLGLAPNAALHLLASQLSNQQNPSQKKDTSVWLKLTPLHNEAWMLSVTVSCLLEQHFC